MTREKSGAKSSMMVNGKPLAGRHIDGFVGMSNAKYVPMGTQVKQKSVSPAKVKVVEAKAPISKPKAEAKPLRAKTTGKRTLQKSHTLNRKAVKKPTAKTNVIKVATKPIKVQNASVPAGRSRRAQSSMRHPEVSRYGANAASEPATITAQVVSPLAVAPEPPVTVEKTQPVVVPPAYKPAVEMQAELPNKFQKHLEQVFDEQTATPKTKTPRLFKRASFLVPGLMALFVAVSFAGYQQLPKISMRVAASRAGFGAELPATPAGFKLSGPISYQVGKVSLAFQSNTDDRNLTIDQQVSDLDPDSLKTGYLEANKIDYESYSHQGRTIFIFNTDDATWVNKGIRYTIQGDSNLSTQQILDLAASL